jgi:predicted xylose isomerase-like sugar epimerase
LDNLTEFLCDTEGISTEDLREDLEAKGVNTDKALARVKAILAKHGITIQGNA